MAANRYYDNTRISQWRTCPRSFYFRHVRHWRRVGNAPALAFGLGWHDAMDVIWTLLGTRPDEEVHMLALTAFNETWTNEGFPGIGEITPDDEADLQPRTPGTANEMLWHYIIQRKKFITQNEVLAAEQPFAVPIDPQDEHLWYVGRLDKQIKLVQENSIITGEHKTSSLYSKTGGIQPRQLDEYSPNSQVDGYIYAGHMLHGREARGVWVDVALVHKTVHDVFKFVPISRENSQLSAWLFETRRSIIEIEREADYFGEMMGTGDAYEDYLAAYPKNTNSCNGKYGRCPFADICKFVPNPQKRYPNASDAPEGFIVDKWEPFNVLGLEKLGMEDEDV